MFCIFVGLFKEIYLEREEKNENKISKNIKNLNLYY